jgi:hypothetical protein
MHDDFCFDSYLFKQIKQTATVYQLKWFIFPEFVGIWTITACCNYDAFARAQPLRGLTT